MGKGRSKPAPDPIFEAIRRGGGGSLAFVGDTQHAQWMNGPSLPIESDEARASESEPERVTLGRIGKMKFVARSVERGRAIASLRGCVRTQPGRSPA